MACSWLGRSKPLHDGGEAVGDGGEVVVEVVHWVESLQEGFQLAIRGAQRDYTSYAFANAVSRHFLVSHQNQHRQRAPTNQ